MRIPPSLSPMKRLLVLLTVALCSPAAAPAQTATLPATAWERLPAHPRLFANAARWTELKQQLSTDPVAQKMAALIRARAEAVLTAPAIEYVNRGSFFHGPMRQVQGRIAGLAMMYRLSGDRRFLDRARTEMTQLAALPDWLPTHFLGTAEGALGMAIGLDWLHDELTPAERTTFENALIEKALRASIADESKMTWIANSNNWNPVCHAGLTAAALIVAAREPALARRIVARALANVPRAAEIYAPAGAYSEGPGYWAYGTTFYVLLTEMLRGAFGTTCDLEKAPGFLATADYVVQMTAPTGDMFNFADSIKDFGFEPVLFWFSRELRRRDLAEFQFPALDTMKAYLVSDQPRHDASRLQPLALLWWNPALPAARTTPRPLVWWSEGGSQPQAVMRSAWNDPRAAFVGLKAGKVFDSHAQMDVGSFIFEADGVRWAVDLGRDSYPLARANGIGTDLFNNAQTSKRWQIFRNGPESHNLLRFDGALLDVNAKAEMRPARNSAGQAPGFIMDLTSVNSARVKRAERGVRLNADRSVLIQDEWETGANAVNAAWQWLTFAQVAVDGGTATLTQAGQSLRLRAQAPSDAAFAVEDVSASRHPWDTANPGLKRITLRHASPANRRDRIVVVAEPGPGVSRASLADTKIQPLAEW